MKMDLITDAIARIESLALLLATLPDDYRRAEWHADLHLARRRLAEILDWRAENRAGYASIAVFALVFLTLIYFNLGQHLDGAEYTWEILASFCIAVPIHLLVRRKVAESLSQTYAKYLRV